MKFFIGLLLGILVAGGTAFYLNKSPNPFVDKGFSGNTNSTGQSLNSSGPLLLAPGTKMQAAAARQQASTANYDFYDVLEGNKDINQKASASAPTQKPQGFILQLGSFSNQDSANNMKARLALLGYSVKIKQQQQNEQMVNRVLIGQFSTMEQAQNLADELKQQDIQSTIINLNQ